MRSGGPGVPIRARRKLASQLKMCGFDVPLSRAGVTRTGTCLAEASNVDDSPDENKNNSRSSVE